MLGPLTSRTLIAQTEPQRENEWWGRPSRNLQGTWPLLPKSFLDVRDAALDLEPLSDNSAVCLSQPFLNLSSRFRFKVLEDAGSKTGLREASQGAGGPASKDGDGGCSP